MQTNLKRLLALILIGFIQPLWALSGPQQLEAFLKDLTTLKADFEQTLQQDDDQAYTSSGVFYLKRPGLLRWEYTTPSEQLIVADGDRIWLHDVELEQVSHRSQKALVGTPAQVLSDQAPITEHFQVNDLGEIDGLNWVELLPKGKESQFASLRLALIDNSLQRIEMIDNFGQTTRFVFDNLQRNPSLEASLFTFKPPPLIDMIGDL